MDIKLLYDLYLKNRIVSTDSRNIVPGCIFFALKGETFNGNLFAVEAVEKGAMVAIVDEDTSPTNDKVIKVDNVLAALQQLALFHRIQTGITILAITGSNGKTTTKELCREVLLKKFRVHATIGNLNNHIGVPLTILTLGAEHQIGVVEMGANHPGEIAALCEIARPDYGLITNIGKAHLEGFGGIQGVARAKGELFNHLMSNEKTLFLNEGNSYLNELVKGNYTRIVRYNGPNGLRVIEESSNPLLHLKAGNGNIEMEIKTNLVGSYNAENILAACCVGFQFGIQKKDIVDAIAGYQPQNNRSQLITTERNTVFMDAYNANPSSMAAAIGEFLKIKGGMKLLILGEMREIGDSSVHEHEEIVTLLKKHNINDVIFVGKAFEQPAKKAGLRHAPSIVQLNQLLAKMPLTGYAVFVKGSRSNHLEKVVEYL